VREQLVGDLTVAAAYVKREVVLGAELVRQGLAHARQEHVLPELFADRIPAGMLMGVMALTPVPLVELVFPASVYLLVRQIVLEQLVGQLMVAVVYVQREAVLMVKLVAQTSV
jgi:hypothetical protein